ncbi:MAG: N-acetylmuramoyl-L-alanine amidase [Bacilli bacterium]|nr:N-acetylmuramoyl-L-alanine amidase [Bacilli bacterium]
MAQNNKNAIDRINRRRDINRRDEVASNTSPKFFRKNKDIQQKVVADTNEEYGNNVNEELQNEEEIVNEQVDDVVEDENINNTENDQKEQVNETAQDNADSAKNMAVDKAKSVVEEKAKSALLKFIAANPWVLAVIIIIIVIIMLILIMSGYELADDYGCSSNNYNYYQAQCKEITVDGSRYEMDDYVAGVLSREVGLFSDSPDTLKAFAIAARTYVLNRVGSDCSIGNSTATQVFSATNDEAFLSAARETSGVVLMRNGSLISTEYDAFYVKEVNSAVYTLAQQDQQIPVSWVNEHNVPATYRAVGAGGHGRGMSQYGAYYLATEKGMNYKELLSYYYGNDIEYYSINASSSGSGATIAMGSSSNYIGTISSKDYTVTNGTTTFAKALENKGSSLNEFNTYLFNEVASAGIGTREGVVAAALALSVYYPELTGYNLEYDWGGKYQQLGANPNWAGQNSALDCSGFVSWSLKNGGFNYVGQGTSEMYTKFSNNWCTSNCSAKPGDLVLTQGTGHVMLIVGVDGDDIYTAEEQDFTYGLLVSKHVGAAKNPTSIEKGRTFGIVNMDSYYTNEDNMIDVQAYKTEFSAVTGVDVSNVDVETIRRNSSNSNCSNSVAAMSKVLLIAGHSSNGTCNGKDNYCNHTKDGGPTSTGQAQVSECRGVTASSGYAEEVETRKFAKSIQKALANAGIEADIANELLSDDGSDCASFRNERVNNTASFQSINWNDYSYVMELHFNASGNHTATGTTTCYSPGYSRLSVDDEIISAVTKNTGYGKIGCQDQPSGLDDYKFFIDKGIPMTYLETEFYDNGTAMNNFINKRDKIAEDITTVIVNNYGDLLLKYEQASAPNKDGFRLLTDQGIITYYNGDGSAMEGGKLDRHGELLEKGKVATKGSWVGDGSVIYIETDSSTYANNKYFYISDTGGGLATNQVDVYAPVEKSALSLPPYGRFTNAKIYLVEANVDWDEYLRKYYGK